MSEALQAQHPTASTPTLARRLACGLYEGIVLFGVGLVPAVLSTVLIRWLGQSALSDAAGQLVGFLCFGLYFTWLWTKSGQTLPMQTWRIRVVRAADGTGLGWQQAWRRYTLCWLWIAPAALVTWLAGWHRWQMMAAVGAWAVIYAVASRWLPDRQFLHDVLAGTRLVNAAAATGPAAR